MTHQPKLDNPEVAHEPRDVPIKGILYFLLVLVLSIAVAMVFLIYLFNRFDLAATEADPGAPPLASERTGPPAPHLQSSSTDDLVAMRAEEEALLTSYGWIDEQDQILRIPIARAMTIVAEQGLPRWTTPGEPQPEGEKPPSEPDPNAQPARAAESPAPSEPAPQAPMEPTQPEVSDEAPAPSPNESEQAQ